MNPREIERVHSMQVDPGTQRCCRPRTIAESASWGVSYAISDDKTAKGAESRTNFWSGPSTFPSLFGDPKPLVIPSRKP